VDVAIGRAAQRTRDGGGAALKEVLKGTAGIIPLGEVDAALPVADVSYPFRWFARGGSMAQLNM
jgi:hypothetical protein